MGKRSSFKRWKDSSDKRGRLQNACLHLKKPSPQCIPRFPRMSTDISGTQRCGTLCIATSCSAGWVVNGLDLNGGLWNDSSAIGILEGRVPQYVQDIFEEHLG